MSLDGPTSDRLTLKGTGSVMGLFTVSRQGSLDLTFNLNGQPNGHCFYNLHLASSSLEGIPHFLFLYTFAPQRSAIRLSFEAVLIVAFLRIYHFSFISSS